MLRMRSKTQNGQTQINSQLSQLALDERATNTRCEPQYFVKTGFRRSLWRSVYTGARQRALALESKYCRLLGKISLLMFSLGTAPTTNTGLPGRHCTGMTRRPRLRLSQ